MKELFNLKGRKALVTGSSGGIGKAIALALAEQGADVMIHGKDNIGNCQPLVEEMLKMGVKSDFVTGSLGEEHVLESIYQKVQEVFGHLDILILNASVEIRKPFLEITKEEFDIQTTMNLWSTFRLIQLFHPAMKSNRWGRIITLGSVQQEKPHPMMAVYASNKCAAVSLVKNLALQFASDGITVNNLAPGVIQTRRNEEVLAEKDYAEKVRAKIPLGFFGEPHDCAGLALLLSSEAGRYITGQNIYCDGGMSF